MDPPRPKGVRADSHVVHYVPCDASKFTRCTGQARSKARANKNGIAVETGDAVGAGRRY